MEKYANAELEIVALSRIDMIASSIEIELDENELPIDDRYASV